MSKYSAPIKASKRFPEMFSPKLPLPPFWIKSVSYKGLLLEWSQKKKVTIKYEITEETLPNKNLLFKSCIYLNNVKISSATETSKKKAEEKAAQRAFYSLNKKENIVEKQKNISWPRRWWTNGHWFTKIG